MFDFVIAVSEASDARTGRYFHLWEWRCTGCGQVRINPDVLYFWALMDALRHELGAPIYCVRRDGSGHSGYRCPEHNRAVGGVADSTHLWVPKASGGRGIGGDFSTVSGYERRLQELAEKPEFFGNHGIGYYAWGLHLDTGPRRRWKG